MKHGSLFSFSKRKKQKKAQEKGVTAVVFDRGGHLYHGRIQALADGARAAGLKF